jgi:hypothetical protein
LDVRHARHARALLHFRNKVIKYRLPCSDQNRGTKGGYRLIAYFDENANTLYPISIFTKSDMEDIDDAEVTRCVQELEEALARTKKP